MAKKELVENIVNLYSKLGGNIGDVLGSRSNITFLGTGKNPEPFIDMTINMEAVGVLGKSKILEELKSPMGYLAANKLNDIQATKLYNNMLKLEEFYYPKQVANITDMATGTRDLTQEGIMTLRRGGDPTKYKPGDPITSENFAASGFAPSDEVLKNLRKARELDDLPPPGSRGGPDDIAAPVQSAEETIKQLRIQDPDLADQVRKMVDQGIITRGNQGAMPVKRANAREFLIEALKKDTLDPATSGFGRTNLNDIVSAEDVKLITEGGGGIGGDPLLLVEKYFGPRIVELIPDERITPRFINRLLTNVEDASGLKPDNPKFDRFTAKLIDEDIPFAEGGRAEFSKGKIVKSGLEGLSQLVQKEKNRTQRIAGNLRSDNMQRTKIGEPKKGVDYDYYRELLDDDEVNIVMGDETEELLEAMLKEQKAEMDYMFRLYKKGALNPTAGETTMGRLKMLEKKAQSGVPLSVEEIAEIKRLSEIFNKAEGGRAGFRLGKSVFKGIANLFTKGDDLVEQEKIFREGPITTSFLEKVNPKVTEKFIRTRDMSGPGSFGMYDNIADMPQGLQAAEFIKNIRGPQGNVDYEKAEMFIGEGVKLTGKESVDELLQMFLNAMKSYKSPFAKGGLAKILEV